jgi:hypothetical protein
MHRFVVGLLRFELHELYSHAFALAVYFGSGRLRGAEDADRASMSHRLRFTLSAMFDELIAKSSGDLDRSGMSRYSAPADFLLERPSGVVPSDLGVEDQSYRGR